MHICKHLCICRVRSACCNTMVALLQLYHTIGTQALYSKAIRLLSDDDENVCEVYINIKNNYGNDVMNLSLLILLLPLFKVVIQQHLLLLLRP